MKMRDGIYNITDRMVGVSSDEEGKTTEGLCRWRKGGGIREKRFSMSIMIGTFLWRHASCHKGGLYSRIF